MSLLDSYNWSNPIPIVYGPGRLAEIALLAKSSGMRNPLIVTDRGSHHLEFIEDIEKSLCSEDMSCSIFSDISPNPRDDEIVAGRTFFRQGKHDGVIAAGGGSGMDGGKAICTIANNNLDLWSFEFEQQPPEIPDSAAFPPLICVPSTAGTGAETESTAMVTDTAKLMKLCTWHPQLKPAYALLDPEITLSMPANLTRWTGCDALVHAIEAYCVPSFDPVLDGIALEALRLISTWLPVVAEQPHNLEARGGMLVGSCLAGIAFQKGLGLVHAVSHMIGAEYDTHHGLTNAVLLPQVLLFNADEMETKVIQMACAMQLEATSFAAFYDAIITLLDALEIPSSLVDIGVPVDCASTIAAKAVQDSAAATNPRNASISEIEYIINTALRSGR